MTENRDQPVYSIGAVASMLAVPASTIRAWEERYGVVLPSRTESSQRLYSRGQVDQLRFVRSQIESGLSAADAHRLLGQELERGGLPLRPSAEAAEPRPLVLIAERDPYASDLAEYLLRTEGYQVCLAQDAVQARLLFEERRPDILIIDLLISGGAGFRLCREFASRGARVLAVAALESGDEAVLAGAAAFIHKPLDPLHLISAVRDLMGTSAATRSLSPVRAPV